jgi:hypothetical protein
MALSDDPLSSLGMRGAFAAAGSCLHRAAGDAVDVEDAGHPPVAAEVEPVFHR